MLIVGNVYNKSTHHGKLIYIGRESSYNKCPTGTIKMCELANPFYMKHESERYSVCNMYAKFIRLNRIKFVDKLNLLSQFHNEKQVYSLLCFCAPKRCHGNEIINFIEEYEAKKL